MTLVEHGLSPALINKEQYQARLIDQYALLFERINREKIDIVMNGKEASLVTDIRQDIIDSWLRSKQAGVDLYSIKCPRLDRSELDKVTFEKQLLIQIAAPYVEQLNHVFAQTRCFVMLTDENGVILQVLGRKTRISREYPLEVGVVWNEQTIGTCSHALSLEVNEPIQIWGPEHYALGFTESTGSAAPIRDAFGNLVGTLTIGSDDEFNQNVHTLGLVISMANSIQGEFQLAAKDELLNATFEISENAVICANKRGIMTHINRKALHLLGLLNSGLTGQALETVLGYQPLINTVLETGFPVYNTTFEVPHRPHPLRLVSIQPIKDSRGNMYGCVVNFNQDDTLTSLKRGGGDCKKGIKFTGFNNIVGSSAVMKKTVAQVQRVAGSSVNVLIQGESGTGKEVFAKAIHDSSRASNRFVAVNCAAIPRNLIESELFGYDSGAFTGARQKGRQGKIELANGGTLFLDEIGDMPLELQPVLLRVLEEKCISRLGSNHEIPVDFRLVAATNKNLLESVHNGSFRQDLYYRLAVFKVLLPPLHERGQDILDLARFFICRVAKTLEIAAPKLSNAAELELLQYAWPGNVRQLENVMIHAVHMCQNGEIWPDDFPEELVACHPETSPQKVMLPDVSSSEKRMNLSMKEIEVMAIKQSLRQCDNNVIEAAKMLGMAKSTMYKKIKKYGLLDG